MTLLSRQVAASSDDARQNTSTVGITAASVNCSGSNQTLGFRFLNITIPQGQDITQALVSFYLADTANDSPNGVDVRMQDEDDTSTFAATNNNISNRTLTGSSVVWSGTDLGVGWHQVDITSLFQGIIDRGGWVSGNSVVVTVKGNGAGQAVTITTWDGNTSLAAKLDVTYTSESQVPRTMHQFRLRRG